MMNRTPVLLFCIGLAQTAPLFASESSPADPAAPAPAATYHSAFEGYSAHREQPIGEWRAANDEVARVGGHAGILRREGGHAGHGAGAPVASTPAPSEPAVSGAPQAPAAAGASH